MNMHSHAAANMSYTANGSGIGMAANHIAGGLSIWTSFSSSSFENDQTYSGVRLDSNQYDANSSAVTVGVDKRLGNMIIGLARPIIILPSLLSTPTVTAEELASY